MDILDKIGQPIVPGSLIVYGHDRGDIAVAKVLAVKFLPQNAGRYTTRDEYRIKINAAYVKRWGDDKGKIILADKATTLQYPDRIIVLNREQLKQEWLDEFDTLRV